MAKFYFLMSLFFAVQSMPAQEWKHGLLLGGGMGYLSGVEYDYQRFYDEKDIKADYFKGEIEYKMNFSLGYKFRIFPTQEPLFVDISLMASIKNISSQITGYTNPPRITNVPSSPGGYYISHSSHSSLTYFNLSPEVTVNYKVFRGFYTGFGVAPTLSYVEGIGDFRFDLSPTGKIGWDLKYVDVSMAWYNGVFNTLKSSHVKKGRTNDLQIQLFIPF